MAARVIDHVDIPVSDLARSEAFYASVLPVLGPVERYDGGDAVGFGPGHWALGLYPESDGFPALHLALKAPSRAAVADFHAAALAAGATCNGAPGVRPAYGADYFAAFVLDPDGHNLEAVCRQAADRGQ